MSKYIIPDGWTDAYTYPAYKDYCNGVNVMFTNGGIARAEVFNAYGDWWIPHPINIENPNVALAMEWFKFIEKYNVVCWKRLEPLKLQKRYYVTRIWDAYYVIDREFPNEKVAMFTMSSEFNAEEKAQQLCDELNKNNQQRKEQS